MADLPDLIAQLRAAAERAPKGEWLRDSYVVLIDTREQVCCGRGYQECCGEPEVRGGVETIAESNEADAAYIVAAQPAHVTRILDAYAEMERALAAAEEALTRHIPEGHGPHPNPEFAVVEQVRAALQQKDKADE